MATDTKQEEIQFDMMTDASSTTFQMNTPPTTMEASDALWSGRGAVPWPENTFQIIEKQSGKAITLIRDRAELRHLEYNSDPRTHWHCVRQNGYFGFQNPQSGRYLGHNGENKIQAQAFHLKEWELWTPREHPERGYELLCPFWAHTLMVLCVEGDGSTLVRRHHGTTLWEFVRV